MSIYRYILCQKRLADVLGYCNEVIKFKFTVKLRNHMCSIKNGVLKNFTKFTEKHICGRVYLNVLQLYLKRENLAQVFSCDFCETFKNTLFTEQLRATFFVVSTLENQ